MAKATFSVSEGLQLLSRVCHSTKGTWLGCGWLTSLGCGWLSEFKKELANLTEIQWGKLVFQIFNLELFLVTIRNIERGNFV